MAGPGGGYKTGKMQSVSASRFAMVPQVNIPRSAFDVQFTHKTTFDSGVLVPVYVDEVLPGDSFRVRMTAFARLATPIVPVMDNIIMESFFFFVPNRLVWEHWERFMGEQDSPTDTTVFLLPQLALLSADIQPMLLPDYFGITLNNVAARNINVNALPFRSYNLIWNEWFRDQDLQDKVVVDVDDGPDDPADYQPVFRGKRHDYFTSARPWPQKPFNAQILQGVASTGGGGLGPLVPGQNMQLPQSGAPVTGLGWTPGLGPVAGTPIMYTGNRTETPTWMNSTASGAFLAKSTDASIPDIRVLVNDIRTAVMVQDFLERNSRGGTRYSEWTRSQFGVTSPDARLQRPEYLGGGRANVTVNPVAQTSATEAGTVLGELAGIGTAIAQGHGFSQSFTEHGHIIGLVSVRADLTYQNGTHRMWFRKTQWDFYVPALAHLGEQAIISKEIFSDGSAGDHDVFGYQERWSEYKYKPSRVSGAFRSSNTAPLDMWHLAQDFGTRPVLNSDFIIEAPPMERVLQVATTAGQEFLFDSFFEVRMVRAMPMFSLPGVGPRL